MKYAGIIKNDFTGAPGVQLTVFVQGCPSPHCKGCHNPETWDFNGGIEFTNTSMDEIIKGLTANGIHRALGIQGGEPLCPENAFLTNLIVVNVQEALPQTKIYIWTGYLIEDLLKTPDPNILHVLFNADFLIDGPYVEEERDITLPMCGSRNQRVIDLKSSHEVANEYLRIGDPGIPYGGIKPFDYSIPKG